MSHSKPISNFLNLFNTPLLRGAETLPEPIVARVLEWKNNNNGNSSLDWYLNRMFCPDLESLHLFLEVTGLEHSAFSIGQAGTRMFPGGSMKAAWSRPLLDKQLDSLVTHVQNDGKSKILTPLVVFSGTPAAGQPPALYVARIKYRERTEGEGENARTVGYYAASFCQSNINFAGYGITVQRDEVFDLNPENIQWVVHAANFLHAVCYHLVAVGENAVSGLQDTVDRLERQLHEAGSRFPPVVDRPSGELATALLRIAELEGQMNDLRSETTALEIENRNLRSRPAAISSSAGSNIILQTQLDEVRDELHAARQNFADATNVSEQLANENRDYEAALEELKANNSTLRADVTRLTAEVTRLTSQSLSHSSGGSGGFGANTSSSTSFVPADAGKKEKDSFLGLMTGATHDLLSSVAASGLYYRAAIGDPRARAAYLGHLNATLNRLIDYTKVLSPADQWKKKWLDLYGNILDLVAPHAAVLTFDKWKSSDWMILYNEVAVGLLASFRGTTPSAVQAAVNQHIHKEESLAPSLDANEQNFVDSLTDKKLSKSKQQLEASRNKKRGGKSKNASTGQETQKRSH